jgi:hypothetical protein
VKPSSVTKFTSEVTSPIPVNRTSERRTEHQRQNHAPSFASKPQLTDFAPIEHNGEKHQSHYFKTRTLRADSRLGYVKRVRKIISLPLVFFSS